MFALKNTCIERDLGLAKQAREVSFLRKINSGREYLPVEGIGAAKGCGFFRICHNFGCGAVDYEHKVDQLTFRTKETIRGWSGGVSSSLREVGTESSKSKGPFDKFPLSRLAEFAMYRFVRFILKGNNNSHAGGD